LKRQMFTLLACAAATVLLSACGTSSSPPTTNAPSPSPSVTAHEAKAGEPPLIHVDGYQYVDPTSAQLKTASLQNLTSITKVFPEAFTAVSVHLVSGPGMGTTWIVEMQLSPTLASPDMKQSMLTGMAAEGMTRADPPMKLVTESGETVAVGTTHYYKTKVAPVWVWIHGDVLTMLLSISGDGAPTYVSAYLATANST